MPHITADRVRDTSTTTGTGPLVVSGSSPAAYRTFSAVCAVGDTFWYAVQHQTTSEWEVGLGTYSAANTITRTTVLSSSAGTSAVSFSAGTKDIFITLAATRTVQTDNAGNVGIGTTAPSGRLDVRGGTLEFDPGGGADATRAFNFNINGLNYGKVLIPSGSGGAMAFWTGAGNAALERMRITNAGNVGIANASPGATLHVGDTVVATDRTVRVTNSNMPVGFDMLVSSGGPGGYLWVRDNSFMSLGTNNQERMRIDNAGRVGINSTGNNFHRLVIREDTNSNANALFQTSSDTANPGFFLNRTRASNAAVISGDVIGSFTFSGWDGSTGSGEARVSGVVDGAVSAGSVPTRLIFSTTPSGTLAQQERMRITSDGRVGINTTSFSANALLQATTSTQYRGYVLNNGTNDAARIIGFGATNDEGGIQLLSGGVERVRILSTSTSYFNGGDVGIGTAGPSAPLTVKSRSSDNIGVRVLASPGNVGGIIQFTNDPVTAEYGSLIGTSTYLLANSSTNLLFQTNGIERMRITSGGNVGIGTTAPLGFSGYGWLTINGSTGGNISLTSGGSEVFRAQATSTFMEYNVAANVPAIFKTNNQERMRILATGEVAVGGITTTGGYPLGVQAASSSATIRVFGRSGDDISTCEFANYAQTVSQAYIQSAPAYFQIAVGGTPRIHIVSATGNVGIGTSNPQDLLHVNATGDMAVRVQSTAASSYLTFLNAGQAVVNNASNTPLVFTTNSIERMRITSSGFVGIGATAPTNALSVIGNINTDQTSGRWVGFGTGTFTFDSVAIPDYGISYTNPDSNFDINVSGFSNVKFTTNRLERMRITSAGNVGIGLTPATRFEVSDASRFRLDVSAASIVTTALNSAASAFAANITNALDHRWQTSGTERMRITSTGNVGIGTTSPGAPLTVFGTSAPSIRVQDATSFFEFYTNGGTSVFNNAGAGALIFNNNGSERMRIDSSGNVGIGTSSPVGRLDVSSTSQYAGITLSGTGRVWQVGSNSTAVVTMNFQHDALAFANYGTERMRIAANGNVGIGGTPSTDTTYKWLTIVGPTTSGGGIVQLNNSDSSVGVNMFCNNLAGYVGTSTAHPLLFRTNNSEVARITSGGEVYIAGTTDQGAFNLQVNGTGVWGAGAYTNGSDARIKEDVSPLTSGVAVVSRLNPVQFRYKSSWSKDTSLQPGFIAQELQTALADQPYVDGVVHQGPQYMSVAYQTLIPVLVKAIQELKAEIDSIRGVH